MLKKSLLATSFLLSLTLASHGTEGQRIEDPFTSMYNSLRFDCGLGEDEVLAQLSFMFDPIPADIVEKRLPDSSTSSSCSTAPKIVEEVKEINLLKVHTAYDGQIKYLDPTDFVGDMMLTGEPSINNLTVRESSAKHFDCFFFSIIGENKELLTQVLEGNEVLADKLLSVTERAGRDFTPVRRAFFDRTLKNLDLMIQMNEGDPISIEDLVRSIIGGDRELRDTHIRLSKPFDSNTMNIGSYFDYLCNSHIYLDDTFAVIFSYLYNVPVYVLNPCNEVGYQSLILQSQTTAYYLLPKTKEPIFIYHLGLFGGHYWKLRLPATSGQGTANSLTTPSSVEASPQESSTTSTLSPITPSSVSASVQTTKTISLLTQEVPLDSSKLNGQKLVLKLMKPVNSSEAQKLATSVTEAIETQSAHVARLEKVRKKWGSTVLEFEASLGSMFGMDEKEVKSIYDPNNETILCWLMSMDITD